MSTFKNKNSLRTIEAQIVQKLKNNEARPKFTGSYKKSVYSGTITAAFYNQNMGKPSLFVSLSICT